MLIFNLFLPVKAPGTYKTETVKLDHTPAYSFGVKTNHVKYVNSPGIHF